MASNTPTADAVIRPTSTATSTTVAMTMKSSTALRERAKRNGSRSIIRTPTATRMPASVATGTHAMKAPSNSATTSARAPCTIPAARVWVPLLSPTSVAPMVPAPVMPPQAADATLAIPCAKSSRSGSWRELVSLSSTTQVFSVSIDSSAASASALPIRPTRCAGLSPPMAPQRSTKDLPKPPAEAPNGPSRSSLPTKVRKPGSARDSRK